MYWLIPMSRRRNCIDLTGQIFGTWLALRRIDGRDETYWECKCKCGHVREVRLDNLLRGVSRNCGCEKNTWKRVANSPSKVPEYNVWRGMIQRCSNPRSGSWQWYGARGITVCDRWRNSFMAFLDDVGHRPTPKHTIERIDNNGNYEPGNVCWATQKQQAQNRRPHPHSTKLTPELSLRISELRNTGLSARRIAAAVGLSKHQVWKSLKQYAAAVAN